MIKRLIFDVDNTLIDWKNEYWNTLKDVFKELEIDYTNDLTNSIIKAIDTYENENQYYNRQTMLEHINKIANYKFDINFLNVTLKKFEKCVPQDNREIVRALEYLKNKYELVILTNWFKDVQEHRLENFGIAKYFEEVFAGETFKIKPDKESFFVAMGERKPEECIMIGDNFEKDIQGAIKEGINAIYINPKISSETKENYTVINKIEELMKIL